MNAPTTNPVLLRVNALEIGDPISVVVERRVYHLTVTWIYNDHSLDAANARTVTAQEGPHGYSVTLRNDNISQFEVRRRSY